MKKTLCLWIISLSFLYANTFSITITDENGTAYLQREPGDTTNIFPKYHYAAGEKVAIQANILERKKFTNWSIVSGGITLSDNNSTIATFIMPENNVEISANYAAATVRVRVNKPGSIVSISGEIDYTRVVEIKTENGLNEYFYQDYALNDCSYWFTHSTNFNAWESNSYGNFYFHLNNFGGGQKSSTHFFIKGLSDITVSATYHESTDAYWESKSTKKGWIIGNFIERSNTTPGFLTTPGGVAFYRGFTEIEKAAIMRALNAIENTFELPPKRTIRFNFAVFNGGASGIGAATGPVSPRKAEGYDSEKVYWNKSDFEDEKIREILGNNINSIKRRSSKVEAVWRDQLNIVPDDSSTFLPINGFVGGCDGTLLFNDYYLKGWYMGETLNGLGSNVDFQSVVMHELGHNICYHSLNTQVELDGSSEFTGLDIFVTNFYNPQKRVISKNMESADGGDAIIYNDFVKSYFSGDFREYVNVVGYADSWGKSYDFGHLMGSPGFAVGAQYRAGGSVTRKFKDFELAFLQEMGYRINPEAWSVAQTPVLSKSKTKLTLGLDAGFETITISNTGENGTLRWRLENIPEWITADVKDGVLRSGENKVVKLSYNSLANGSRTSEITLFSSTPSVKKENARQIISINQEERTMLEATIENIAEVFKQAETTRVLTIFIKAGNYTKPLIFAPQEKTTIIAENATFFEDLTINSPCILARLNLKNITANKATEIYRCSIVNGVINYPKNIFAKSCLFWKTENVNEIGTKEYCASEKFVGEIGKIDENGNIKLDSENTGKYGPNLDVNNEPKKGSILINRGK